MKPSTVRYYRTKNGLGLYKVIIYPTGTPNIFIYDIPVVFSPLSLDEARGYWRATWRNHESLIEFSDEISEGELMLELM